MSLLRPGNTLMDAYSLGLNCREPGPARALPRVDTARVQLTASPGTAEPALAASFQRKPELNKLLWVKVSEPFPQAVLHLTHRHSL